MLRLSRVHLAREVDEEAHAAHAGATIEETGHCADNPLTMPAVLQRSVTAALPVTFAHMPAQKCHSGNPLMPPELPGLWGRSPWLLQSTKKKKTKQLLCASAQAKWLRGAIMLTTRMHVEHASNPQVSALLSRPLPTTVAETRNLKTPNVHSEPIAKALRRRTLDDDVIPEQLFLFLASTRG